MSKTKTKTPNASSDYEVGRGKPPRHTQFKKGQSGNPGGRKKESRNLKTILDGVMASEIAMSENGTARPVSLTEAIFRKQAQSALQGDWRAGAQLLDRYERYQESEEALSAPDLSEEEAALLARVLARQPQPVAPRGDSAEDGEVFDEEAVGGREPIDLDEGEGDVG